MLWCQFQNTNPPPNIQRLKTVIVDKANQDSHTTNTEKSILRVLKLKTNFNTGHNFLDLKGEWATTQRFNGTSKQGTGKANNRKPRINENKMELQPSWRFEEKE